MRGFESLILCQEETPLGVSSFFSEVLRDSTPSNARLRRSLANRQLDADCSLRFAPKANRPSNPSSSASKEETPFGVSSLFSEVLRDSNPSNARLRWSLANRQLDADCSLRFAFKGKSAIESLILCQEETPLGVSSFFSEVLRDSTPSNARLRRSLANRQLDADCSLRFAPKANRPSNPSSSAKKGLLNNPKRKSQTLSRNGKGLLFLTHQGCG